MNNETQPDLDGKRMRAAIYAVEHIPTGRRLICATNCLSKRLSDQLRYLRAGQHYNAELQADLKQGADSFHFIFLESVHRVSQLRLLKKWHIADAQRRGIPLYNAPDPATRRLLMVDGQRPSLGNANEAMRSVVERLRNLDLRGDDRLNALIEKLVNDPQPEAKTPNQEHSERK